MDYTDYLKFFAALVFVLAMMGGLAFLLKKLGLDQHGGYSRRAKRLKVIEVLPIDSKRKAALIQRDGKQHLVLLGANSETVIETDIEPLVDDENKK
jgi:flagellar protein FliO/FliZ